MKMQIVVFALAFALTLFGLRQWRENARQQIRLQVQAESIERLERIAATIDAALLEWRNTNAAIVARRQETRDLTRETARRDPTFKEHLDTPLHPALRPGGGLLGSQGRGAAAPASSADATDARP